MITVDWTAFALGSSAGALMSLLFFAGLAFGLQRALHSDRLVRALALSAALRIAPFLAVAWLVMEQADMWGFAGYGLAFVVCRRVAIAIVQNTAPRGQGQ